MGDASERLTGDGPDYTRFVAPIRDGVPLVSFNVTPFLARPGRAAFRRFG